MIFTGVLKPTELYLSVEWNVIFLLADVVPLGIALQQTEAAALLRNAVASTAAFLPPIGYQTNLFVYGSGRHTFSDFIRVGVPLQFLLSIVTVLGIAFFWGVCV